MKTATTEYVTFELVMHFEPELEGSIDDLKKAIKAALRNIKEVQDIELSTLESGAHMTWTLLNLSIVPLVIAVYAWRKLR